MQYRGSNSAALEENHRFFSRFLNRTNSFHPLLFGHVLIRLGHEPLKPSLHHTPLSLVGLAKPVYMYPWIGKYVWHLGSSLGWLPLFTTGLAASYFSAGLMGAAEESALSHIRRSRETRARTDDTVAADAHALEVRPLGDTGERRTEVRRHPSIVWALRSIDSVQDVSALRPEDEQVSDVIDLICEERSVGRFVAGFCHLMMWRLYGIVITHPFRVVMVRQIAFAAAGGRVAYSWFPLAAQQVYRENGMRGFFQGLVPRLLAELLVLSSVVNIYRVLRLYLLDECDSALLHVIRSILWIFHTHYIHEPLLTVSDLLVVRCGGLNLPVDGQEVVSSSWHKCWDYLASTQQLLRASSWFFRRRVRAPADA